MDAVGVSRLPMLAAIYWLRSRSRRVVVSSLILWTDQRRPKQGGLIFQRLQTPASLFLELLAIAMLTPCGGGAVHFETRNRSALVVVLDGLLFNACQGSSIPGGDRPDRAAATLNAELERERYTTRLVLAGSDLDCWARRFRRVKELTPRLKQWTCQSRWADLSKAINWQWRSVGHRLESSC